MPVQDEMMNRAASLIGENSEVVESLENMNAANEEESLLKEACDIVDNAAISDSLEAVDAKKVSEEQERMIAEHNRRVMQSPEFKAAVLFDNYVKTCGRVLSGSEKRTIRRRFLAEAKKGKYDYLFDEEKMRRRQERQQAKFDKLNAPVIHTVDDLDEDTKATLQEMAKMETFSGSQGETPVSVQGTNTMNHPHI